jgi:hypothetical protein
MALRGARAVADAVVAEDRDGAEGVRNAMVGRRLDGRDVEDLDSLDGARVVDDAEALAELAGGVGHGRHPTLGA